MVLLLLPLCTCPPTQLQLSMNTLPVQAPRPELGRAPGQLPAQPSAQASRGAVREFCSWGHLCPPGAQFRAPLSTQGKIPEQGRSTKGTGGWRVLKPEDS